MQDPQIPRCASPPDDPVARLPGGAVPAGCHELVAQQGRNGWHQKKKWKNAPPDGHGLLCRWLGWMRVNGASHEACISMYPPSVIPAHMHMYMQTRLVIQNLPSRRVALPRWPCGSWVAGGARRLFPYPPGGRIAPDTDGAWRLLGRRRAGGGRLSGHTGVCVGESMQQQGGW